jgi:putative ABC transport system ATP-binding protein
MIRLTEVTKVYRRGPQEVRALDGVSTSIAQGEFVAVMGPSGSGKSTLLHLVGALDGPTSGEIEIAGRSLSRMKDEELTLLRRERIGFVFQFFNLLPTLSARENVELPLLLEGVRPREARRKADAMLERVGIAGRGDHHADELSGGEMQRAAIARALVKGAPLLLADEPTGNLDSATGREILGLLERLHRDGLTVVIVTHDPTAASIAGGILHLKDGRIVQDTRANGASTAALR